MPSEKLTRILRSKTDLSVGEISILTEKEGWDIVYSLKPTKKNLNEICFTGFNASEKNKLIDHAEQHGLKAVKSVTKSLRFLCAGENAGPAKLKKAQDLGSTILSFEQYHQMVETGELPD